MKDPSRRGRVNLTAVLILVLVTGLLGSGAVLGHRVRKQAMANRWLADGKAALEQRAWAKACEHLKLYLSKYPDDREILSRYAEANLAVRPMESKYIQAAIAAYRRLIRSEPDSAHIARQLIKLHTAMGDYIETAYVCRKRLDVDPDDADAMYWLGNSLAAQGKPDEARPVLMSLVEKRPDQVRGYALLSALAMQENSLSARQEALEWLNLCVQQNPRSSKARAHRARFHRIAVQDMDSAVADLEAADAREPNDPEVLLLLAEEWMSWGYWDQAQAELNGVREIPSEELARFEIDPDALALATYATASNLALRRGAKQEGAALADRALAALMGRARDSFLPVAVDLYLAAGRLDQARAIVDEYRDAVELRSEPGTSVSETLVLLEAALATAEGKPYAAIEKLKPIVTTKPQTASAWKLLWRAYEKAGQTRRAIEALEEYVTRAGDDWPATRALASLYKNRDWSKALSYAQQAERARPNDLVTKLLRIEAQAYAAPAGAAAQEHLSALSSELDGLRESHPDNCALHTLQAVVTARLGRAEDTASQIERALEACDAEASASVRLAILYAQLGRLEEAIEACKTAVERHADQAKPRITLAELQLADDRPAESRVTLGKAVKDLTGKERALAVYALARFMRSHDERPGAIALLRELTAERPNDAQPRQELLKLPEVQTDPNEARKLVNELRQIEGDAGLLWKVEQANLWLRGDDWSKRKDRIKSMLATCMEADPGWPAPALAMGRLYEMLGQDDRAEGIYRRLVGRHSFQPDAVNRLLWLLERQRRFGEANEVLNSAPKGFAVLSEHRVKVSLGLGDISSAVAELQALVANRPADAMPRVVLARLLYEHEQDREGAMKLLDEAQVLDPELLAVVSGRAAILQSEGQEDQAVALLDAEVNRRNDYASYLLRAEYYDDAGEFELAEKDFTHLTAFPDSQVEGYIALGEFYRAHDKTDQAVAAWEAGLKVDPQNPSLRRKLMEALVVSTKLDLRTRGLAMLDELQADSPDDPSLLAVRAGVVLEEQGPDAVPEAADLLERVVRKDPRNVAAHQYLIKLAHQQGNLNKAIGLATQALGANPENVDLRLVKAGLETEMGNVRVARELARSVLDTDRDNATALNMLAELALREGDFESAERFNDRALALDPASETAQLVGAKVLTAKGRPDQAILRLESFRRTEHGQASVVTLTTLASLHRRQGDFETAGRRLDEAEQLDPDGMSVFLARLRWLGAQNRSDEILARLSEWRADHPDGASVLIVGGSLLASTGTERYLRQAKNLFEQAVALEPNSTDAHLGLAQAAYRTNEVSAAEQAYRQVLRINPYHQQSLNDLAWILGVDLDKPAEAIEFVDKGVSRYPDDPHMLDTRGILLERLDRLAEARKDLEECVRIADGIPYTRAQALFHLGRVCLKQGESTTARQKLGQALEIDRRHRVFTSDERAEIERLVRSASG